MGERHALRLQLRKQWNYRYISIKGTDDDVLWKHERAGNCEYSIPVPPEPATYDVVMHFAETTYEEEGNRLFDIFVEGSLMAEGLDILKEAGGPRHAYTLTVQVQVTDGSIELSLQGKIQEPRIAAIEIHTPRSDRPTIPGVYETPLVGVAGSTLPDGRILLWSSADRYNFNYNRSPLDEATQISIFNPKTKTASLLEMENTHHDMFCPVCLSM